MSEHHPEGQGIIQTYRIMSVPELNAIAADSSRSLGVHVFCLVRVRMLLLATNEPRSRTGRFVKKQIKNCVARTMKMKSATVYETSISCASTVLGPTQTYPSE